MEYLSSHHIAIVLSFLQGLYGMARANFEGLHPLEVAAALEAMADRIRKEESLKRKSSDRPEG